MAYVDNIDVLNNAATAGNWVASGFDAPTLDDSAATTPTYLEGVACMTSPDFTPDGTLNARVASFINNTIVV